MNRAFSLVLRRALSTLCRGVLTAGLLLDTARAEPPLTLSEAMRRALEATPDAAIEEALRDQAAARLGTARTGLLPDLSVSGSVTLGSGNVVAGGAFVPGGYPTVSGPPTEIDLSASWQAMGGATLRWDLLGLLARVRDTDAALASVAATDAGIEARRLDRATRAGLAWIDAAEAGITAGVAHLQVERARSLLQVAGALVDAGLRPGVDRAMAAAELALAEQALTRATGAERAAHARLATALGEASRPYTLSPAPEPPAESSDDGHPALVAAEADLRVARAQLAAVRARFAPRLELLGAGWVRAGVWPPDEPTRVAPNWSGGVVVEVPLLDLPTRRAEATQARAAQQQVSARQESVRLEVQGQRAEAEALSDAARATAAYSEALVTASQEALTQARSRYEAGLVDLTTVATALARAHEAELVALAARSDVLRTALGLANAHGDLTPWTELDR